MKLGIDDAAVGISEEGGPYPPYIIEDALLPEAVLNGKEPEARIPHFWLQHGLCTFNAKVNASKKICRQRTGIFVRRKK